MTMVLSSFRALFRQIHRIDSSVEDVFFEHEDVAIKEALTHHSLHLPCRGSQVVEVTDGSFDLTVIPGWSDRWLVERVTQRGRALPRDWWTVEGDTLHLATTGSARVEYIRPHQLDECGTTLRDDEIEPFAHLAAHFLFAQMSNEYMKRLQSSINADAVNFSGQNVGYFTKSQDELRRYQAYVALRYRPGSARVDYDSRSRTGRPYIFRDGRYE